VIRFFLPTGDGRARAVRAAAGSSRRCGALLELRDPDSRSGWGEASPLPGFTNDTPRRAFAALLGLLADPAATSVLYGAARELAAAGGETARGQLLPDGASALLREVHRQSPSARAAVVSALLDLAGRRAGLPTHELLLDAVGGPEPARSGYRVNALIPLTGREAALEAASEAHRRGIGVLKAKLGNGEELDRQLALLHLVRSEYGAGVRLRLDANGAWAADECPGILERLAPLDPEYVEEPVSGAALLEIAGSPVPLAADESLRDPGLASALLASETISVFVLKPPVLGGIDRCLELGRRAIDRGRRCVVTHAFEGPVAHGAACEAALALAALASDTAGSRVPAQGLDRVGVLDAWTEIAVPQLRGPGLLPAEVSGHGIDPAPLIENAAGEGRI
jgi:L-alanine-DL-glutamate epimerase-like enolase superfamily enzyme